jgi:hypothetical protein
MGKTVLDPSTLTEAADPATGLPEAADGEEVEDGALQDDTNRMAAVTREIGSLSLICIKKVINFLT